MLTPGLNAANPALPQRRPSNSNYQWHPARHLAHTSNRAVNNKHNWTATLTNHSNDDFPMETCIIIGGSGT